MLPHPDLLSALSQLSLTDIDQRLADLDAERSALTTLRRSIVAREKTKRRRAGKPATGEEVRHE